MYYQQSIFDGTEQSTLEQSLRLLREFEHVAIQRDPRGYAVGYSGGKDSDVLVQLFRMAGVKFFVFHSHTTLDAPETVYYVRRKFAELTDAGIPCMVLKPEISFWELCLKKNMLPFRMVRFCCSELKEADRPEIERAVHSFGVRKAESVRRSLRRDSIEMRDRKDYSDIQLFHHDDAEKVRQTQFCYQKHYFIVNPLAYWTENYLWNFIQDEHLELNPLYSQGFNRVGCIGCPMATWHRIEQFERYPKYKERYIKLCDDIIRVRKEKSLPNKYEFKTGEEYFNFWLYETLPVGESIFDTTD